MTLAGLGGMGHDENGGLRVRSRRTLEADLRVALAQTVCCPRRGHATLLEACVRCNLFDGMSLGGLHPPAVLCCAAAAAVAAGRSAEDTPVEEAMSGSVECVAGAVRAADVRQLLLEARQQAVPVVDGNGCAVGIISRLDLLARQSDALTAHEVMSAFATVVTEKTPLARAAALMALDGVHQLPVVSAGPDRSVVGLVTALDVVAWIARQGGYLRAGTPA